MGLRLCHCKHCKSPKKRKTHVNEVTLPAPLFVFNFIFYFLFNTKKNGPVYFPLLSLVQTFLFKKKRKEKKEKKKGTATNLGLDFREMNTSRLATANSVRISLRNFNL